MESTFGLLAAIIVVIIVAIGLAISFNRAEEEKTGPSGQNKKKQQKSSKDSKKKKDKKASKNNKPVPNVVFKSDGKVENEDESMVELLQGTAKYYAQEAKNASADAAKKLQQAAAETKAAAENAATKAVKGAKNAAKKVQAVVEEQIDEASYTSVPGRQRKAKADKETSADAEPEQAGKKKKQKAFLKNEIPPPREKGADRRKKDKKETSENASDNAGAVDGEGKPQRRNRPPRQQEEGQENSEGVEGEEKRPRQPRGPKGEPKERKPREVQPLPAPLPATNDDIPSLDQMLGYLSTQYRVQETIFTKLAERPSERVGLKKKVNTLSGEDIIIRILSKLPLKDVIAVSQVDQFFSKITRGDALWRALGARDFPKSRGGDNKKDSKGGNKRAKALYRDKYDEAHGRKAARPAKQAKEPKAAPAEEPAAAVVEDGNSEKKKKAQKKPKDTSA